MSFLVTNEFSIRIAFFIGVFLILVGLEAIVPRKGRVLPRLQRWKTNLALVAITGVLLRFLAPIMAVGMASWAQVNNVGLLNWVHLPAGLAFLFAFVLLDMSIYFQHVLSHRVPVFWRFHRVHHADRDVDVTTGVRFHPVEMLLSMLYKLACVAVIGPSVLAVIVFEIVLNASAMFNHANIRLPRQFDHFLRKWVVTPDFHRVHHSVIPTETDSNFGFFLSIWDRLFGTCIEQPQKGHSAMLIGLAEYQTECPSRLSWSLAMPFYTPRLKKG